MAKHTVIIGAGRIGRAIEGILAKREVKIELWDKDASKVSGQKDLAETVPAADFLFLCVSSWALIEALKHITPHLKKGTVIVSLAKGVVDFEGRALPMNGFLEAALPKGQPFSLLYGPMMAEELNRGLLGFGVVAAKSKSIFNKLAKIFADTNLRIAYSKDLRGASLAGVLKNVYSIGLGIADGLTLGCNAKGYLTSKAVSEMSDIIKLLGGKPSTILGLAGLGDLAATGFSPHSRNRRVGDELVRMGQCCLESEGFVSLPYLVELLGDKAKDFPFFFVLVEIIIRHKNAAGTFEGLCK